jgi:hypothetical protein
VGRLDSPPHDGSEHLPGEGDRQITKVGSVGRLQIHALRMDESSDDLVTLCGNEPGPGKVLTELDRGRVTCERCLDPESLMT